jgi:hypothetical protein
MDAQQRIEPERVTKPIQLLAAWLVGLITVDGSFLLAAANMGVGTWERGALIVAAIANVPLFLFALFLLQTRFRPELQEDSYYSKYLDKRTNQVVTVRREEVVENELATLRADIRSLASQAELPPNPDEDRLAGSSLKIGLNHHFAELREVIRAAGLPLYDVFGTAALPKARVMAIAEYLPFSEKIRMLRLAVDMKLDAYGYFNPPEEKIREDILVGSYGAPQYQISPELTKVMDNSPEPADLTLYEQRHRIRTAKSGSA